MIMLLSYLLTCPFATQSQRSDVFMKKVSRSGIYSLFLHRKTKNSHYSDELKKYLQIWLKTDKLKILCLTKSFIY